MALLQKRAKLELGEAASPLDWVCDQVGKGLNMREIAELLAPNLKSGVSRNFVSGVANNLTADARARIAEARRPAPRAEASRG